MFCRTSELPSVDFAWVWVCAFSAGGPNSSRTLAELRPNLADLVCRCLPMLVDLTILRPTLTNIGQTLVKLSPNLVDACQLSASTCQMWKSANCTIGQHRPFFVNLDQVGPTLVNVVQNWCNSSIFGRTSAESRIAGKWRLRHVDMSD